MNYVFFFPILAIVMAGCTHQVQESESQATMDWKTQVAEKLPGFGHRNWILIVDKAFPAQTATGITTINTGEDILDVLNFTLQEIDHSTHVKPIVYTDQEFNFITSDMVGNIDEYRRKLDAIIGQYNPRVMLHDSVFVQIDEASKLFKVLVLKTEEVIAYSSVFIELDCRYWSAEKEHALRAAMKE